MAYSLVVKQSLFNFLLLTISIVSGQRQQIQLNVFTNEVDGNSQSIPSTTNDFIVDLGEKLREQGLQATNFTFSVVYHTRPIRYENSFTQIRLDSATGKVRNPLHGYDREVICSFGVLSKPCVDRYMIQAEPLMNNNGNKDIIVFDLMITIRNVNDHKPQFQSRNIVKKLAEDCSMTTPINLPKAIDKDSKDDVQNYRLVHTEDSAHFFEIEIKDQSGEIAPFLRLLRSLDRESKAKFQMTLIAEDREKKEGELLIEIDVIDINDNKPEWSSNSNWSIILSECEQRREPDFVAQFNATDRDDGKFGNIVYELSESNSLQVLKTFYIVGNYLRLNKELDYDNNELENPLLVEVDAKDGGGLVNSKVFTINIADCNDNSPEITMRYFEKIIGENVQNKQLVAQVYVIDRDSGNNGRVECALSDDSKLIAEEDSNDKSVPLRIYKVFTKTTSKFDRETQESYHTLMVCRDHGSPSRQNTISITLKIDDENDEEPIFKQKLHHFRIEENLPSATLIGVRIKASDADTGANAQLTYSLDMEGSKYFTLESNSHQTSGVELRSRQSFDREVKANYNFTLVVKDNGSVSRSATTTIYVDIEDKNDNAPHFQQEGRYIFNITETDCATDNKPICAYKNILVGQVYADDRDLGASAIITYKLGSLLDHNPQVLYNIHTYFHVEARSGKIYTKSALDREQKSDWKFEVVAQDHGEPIFSSTATVTLIVLDINDNRPQFEFPSSQNHTVTIDELAVSGTILTQIKAKDSDAGINGTAGLMYKFVKNIGPSLADKYFELNSDTGVISLVQRLDNYKHSHINLLVQVEDGGNPPTVSRLTSLQVIIQRRRKGATRTHHGTKSLGNQPRDDLQPTQDDNSMQVLLILAGVVFVVFAALIGVVVYMYANGNLSLPCSACLKDNPRCKDDLAAVTNTVESGTHSRSIRGSIKSGVKNNPVTEFSSPQTLRRNQSQETGYFEQERFSDIIHFDNETLREKIATTNVRNDVEQINLLKTKSLSYAYIPVACEDRYTHLNNLRKENTDTIPTQGAATAGSLYQTMQINSNILNDNQCHSGHSPEHPLHRTIQVKSRMKSQDEAAENTSHCERVLESMAVHCSSDSPASHAYTILNTILPHSAYQTNVKTPYITSSFV